LNFSWRSSLSPKSDSTPSHPSQSLLPLLSLFHLLQLFFLLQLTITAHRLIIFLQRHPFYTLFPSGVKNFVLAQSLLGSIEKALEKFSMKNWRFSFGQLLFREMRVIKKNY
jgi:hypothetical protein